MTIYEGMCGSLVCSSDSTSFVAVVGSTVVSEFDATACIATIEDKVSFYPWVPCGRVLWTMNTVL
jgi:hypothetical protein